MLYILQTSQNHVENTIWYVGGAGLGVGKPIYTPPIIRVWLAEPGPDQDPNLIESSDLFLSSRFLKNIFCKTYFKKIFPNQNFLGSILQPFQKGSDETYRFWPPARHPANQPLYNTPILIPFQKFFAHSPSGSFVASDPIHTL